MNQISIRNLEIEQAAPVFNWMTSYAFTETPPVRDADTFKERFKHAGDNNKYLAVFAEETAVATAGAGKMAQNVRGELVDSAGVFMVATHPAHRRKGYSFLVLKALFEQLRAEGYGFSTLYPFRESFYERLGYANWPAQLIAELNPRALAPLIDQETEAALELVEFIQQPDSYFDFLPRYQQHTHGVATFKKRPPPDPERHKAWVLTSRINGEMDGVMLYQLQGSTPTQFKFNAFRFYTLSPASRYALLGWIARHIDQTHEVSIYLPPFEQPHTWFSDLEIKLSARDISPMGRVLDIEKLNGLPCGEGHFTAEIIDPVCPWNEGSWTFTGTGGKLAVEKSSSAGCQLTIQGLSALVFGTQRPESYKFRNWGDIQAETCAQMTAIFPPMIPHLHEMF